MSLVQARVDAPCPKHPEGVHGWAVFPGGIGCNYCDAWKPSGRAVVVDPLPTGLIGLAASAG